MTTDERTFRYTIKANKEGAVIEVSPEFWEFSGNGGSFDRRVLQILGELQAALQYIAVRDNPRH